MSNSNVTRDALVQTVNEMDLQNYTQSTSNRNRNVSEDQNAVGA
jgi:hypothetical protein